MLVVAGVLIAGRPQLFAYAAMVLAFTVFPSGVPFILYVGGSQVYAYEPFLLLAFVWSVALAGRATRHAFTIFAVGIIVAGGWSLWGLGSGYQFGFINTDVRPLLDLLLAIPVAATLARSPYARSAWRTLLVILWVSAVMTTLSSASGFALAGREEAATLDFGSSTSGDATRFLTTATDLATVVLCGLIASALVYRVSRSWVWGIIPSFIIVFFAFSRNALLGLGAALVVALIWALINGLIRAVATRLVGALVAFVALAVVTQFLPALSSTSGWLGAQLSAVSSRVFGGISSTSLSSDPSALYRTEEIYYLVPSFKGSPLLGHGFGYAYKPPLGSGISFFTVQGRYYAHQYYLWILVKVGVVGCVLLLGGWLSSVVVAARARSAVALTLVAGLSAGMTISGVAPMPNGEPGALVIGSVVGLLSALPRYEPPVQYDATSAEAEVANERLA